ncbi:MAG TPA: metalloregulator ArsR/SmtB family transcription factor [bacterium]|nr:metalloregulator ArsR/SmtB family transcription factor [bacterium]
MVKYGPRLDATLAAIADPVRRAILSRLAGGQAAVTQLAAEHDMSLPAFLKHVRVLESADLISTRKLGRTRICELSAVPLSDVWEWLLNYRTFWEGQLDSLGRYLSANQSEEKSWDPPSAKSRPSSKSGARIPPRKKRSIAPGRKKRR